MLYEAGRDFLAPLFAVGFRSEADVLAEAKKRPLPKYMPLLEKVVFLYYI